MDTKLNPMQHKILLKATKVEGDVHVNFPLTILYGFLFKGDLI